MNKRLKTDLEVICEPTWVKIQCPYCKEDFGIYYNEFAETTGIDCWCDWEGELVNCEHCDEVFEIDCVHME